MDEVLSQVITSAMSRASSVIEHGLVWQIEAYMRRAPPRRDLVRERLIALARHYRDGTMGPDSPFFAAPPAAQVTVTPAGDGPSGSRMFDLAFPSEYRPYLPSYRDEHLRWRDNLVVHARRYTSRTGRGSRSDAAGRPTIIMVHGWGGGAFWIEERAFVIPFWLRQGFDVAVVQLPFHGRRAPSTAPWNWGTLFPSTHLVRTNEGFGQAIWDLRSLSAYLRTAGASAVGAMGMSLGAYTTSLWASLDSTLDFAVAVIPPVSLAEIMWRHGHGSPTGRAAIKAGVTLELLEEVFAVHTPITRPVRLPKERLTIVAGRGDLVCTADHTHRLAEHWGGCEVHWFPGGHVAQVGRTDAFQAVSRRLAMLDLPGHRRDPVASQR